MTVFIPALFVFLISTALPMYLAHIRAKHMRFWFNVLPIGQGSFWATLINVTYYRENRDSWEALLVFMVCMILIIAINVAFITIAYRLIFNKSIYLGDNE